MKLPDGPRTPFLLQTIHLIARHTNFIDKCAQRYGDTFTLRVLGLNSPPVVFFGNPQDQGLGKPTALLNIDAY
jgi:cytochrome P450